MIVSFIIVILVQGWFCNEKKKMPWVILRGQVINEKLMAVSLLSYRRKTRHKKLEVEHCMVLKDCDHDVAIKLANSKNLKKRVILVWNIVELSDRWAGEGIRAGWWTGDRELVFNNKIFTKPSFNNWNTCYPFFFKTLWPNRWNHSFALWFKLALSSRTLMPDPP